MSRNFLESLCLIGLAIGCLGIACVCHAANVSTALLGLSATLSGIAARHLDTANPTQTQSK